MIRAITAPHGVLNEAGDIGKWRSLYPDGRQRVPDRLMVKIEGWRSVYQLQEYTYGFPLRRD